MSPWSKKTLGWVTPLMIESDGVYTARASATNPDIYMISAGGYADREYLLIENRQPLLFDIDFPAGGLLIYHVDETANDMRGFPGQSGWPSNGNHYQVAMLQADGLYNLEKAENNGDAGDFFVPGMEFGPGNGGTVFPNTDAYNGGAIVETGIRIFNIVEVETAVYSFEVSGLGGSTTVTTPAPVATTDTTPAPVTSEPTTSKPTVSPSTSFAPTAFGETRSPTAVTTPAPTTAPEPPKGEEEGDSPTATPPAAVTSAGTAASTKWSFWKTMMTTTVMAVATVLLS
jgi:hypothetical protein